MQMISRVLRATHCRSTHHYFALDALKQLKTPPAQRLGRLLLKYHDEYLDGAKAPDTRFKDFHNHVIHVDENNWGGAAQKCQEWIETALEHFNKSQWKRAAYACGVLSHYFTDPLMPLNTAHCPDHSAIYRPLEWSVFQAYNEIYQISQQELSSAEFQFANDERWIYKASLAVAQVSKQHVESISQNYYLTAATRAPDFGLNAQSRRIFATLFTLAIDGWAAVLSRLADEIKVDLPATSLRLPSVLAAVDMPLAWIVSRISYSSERRAVAATIKEYERAGVVRNHMAQEVRAIQRAKDAGSKITVHQPAETGQPELTRQTSIEEPSISSETNPSRAISDTTQSEATWNPKQSRRLAAIVLPDDASQPGPIPAATTESSQVFPNHESETDLDPPIFLSLSEARARLMGTIPHAPSEQITSPLVVANGTSSRDNPLSMDEHAISKTQPASTVDSTAVDSQRVYPGSPLIEAPSIGPKTAKRFEKVGIRTIDQFTSRNPDDLESLLATRWITASLVADWQDQARLVCEVPELTGVRAQLLVAIGCRTAWQLRTSNAPTLVAQLSQFCQTAEGQQILNSSDTPNVVEVASWIESARSHARSKAA